MTERVLGAARVQEDEAGMHIVVERVAYVMAGGHRKVVVRSQKVLLPKNFHGTVAEARSANRLIRVCYEDRPGPLQAILVAFA